MNNSSRCVERSRRIYGALIKAYPAAFRSQYADEMARVFGELLADAWRERGMIGLVTTWFRVLGDFVWTVPQEHFIEMKGRIAVKTRLFTRRVLMLTILLATLLLYSGYRVAWQLPSPILNAVMASQR
jgi:hypothetical protein